jgi:SAM-dependent methyltransferase
MNTQWLPRAAMDLIRENPRIYRPLRAARWWAGRIRGARKLEGVPRRVHFNDFMLRSSQPEDVRLYLQGAMNVVEILQRSLETCGKNISSLTSCLEIGSGYGRIIRHISQVMPPANIYACDVIEEGSRFCAREFGVNYFPRSSLADMRNADRFEFIYLISVFSHLDSASISKLWSQIVRMLKPAGMAVFTTQGKVSAGQVEKYGAHWEAEKAAISEALSSGGYFYEKYKWYKDNIGMTWVTEDFLRNLLEETPDSGESVRFCGFDEGILDGHQDVYTYQKM